MKLPQINQVQPTTDSSQKKLENLREPSVPSGGRADAQRLFDQISGQERSRPQERDRLESLGRRCLPPKPDSTLIKPAMVPPPAKLTAFHNDTELVVRLASAYNWACQDRFRKTLIPWWERGDLRKHKQWDFLLDSGGSLLGFDIAPGGWCLYSFDKWKDLGITDKPPTVAWTYSHARLREPPGELFDDLAYAETKQVFAPEHLSLLSDWVVMWQTLLVQKPQNTYELVAIVDECFPVDSWEVRVERAQRQSRALQADIDRQVADGGVYWQR